MASFIGHGRPQSHSSLLGSLHPAAPHKFCNIEDQSEWLSPQALAILNGLPRIGDSDLIFTMTGATAISGFTRAKRRLDVAMAALNGGAQIAAWAIHDIRRGVVSSLASIDVQLPFIERIVNHISGSFAGVAGIYQRHQFEPEKRAALGRWANHIERVVTGSGEVKVIKMKGNRI
jgi:hypothetical protein